MTSTATPLLSCRTAASEKKRSLYSAEVYYREAVADIMAAWGDNSEEHLRHVAAALLKPETVASRGLERALDFLCDQGFRIIAATRLAVTRLMTREVWRYRFNIATNERLAVMDLIMGAGESLYLLLYDESAMSWEKRAADRLKAIKGPSDPASRSPGQLRTILGRRSHLLNYLHAPDEPADVVRELSILFDRSVRGRLLSEAARKRDCRDEVMEEVRALYAATSPHDLCFQSSLDRVETICRNAEQPFLADCGDCLCRIKAGQSRDWERLFCLLACAGMSVAHWDQTTVASELVQMNIPGREPLL